VTVYAESNFVLEITLGQEQAEAAESILQRAEHGDVTLALPSFCLSEPFATVTQRGRRRLSLAKSLRAELQQLHRSRPHRQDVATIDPSPDALIAIGERENHCLIATLDRILGVSIIIPVDAGVYREALSYVAALDLSGQDAIIYASVLSHLRGNTSLGRHVFVTRNWRDFANPEIVTSVLAHGCELIGSFVECALRLEGITPEPRA